MTRAKNNVAAKQRHKKYLKMAKGYYGARRKNYRAAREAVERALVYAYEHRKTRKRDFRRLWITRINAAVRKHGMSYSKFMHALKEKNIDLNRKLLAELAVNNREAFAELVAQVNN